MDELFSMSEVSVLAMSNAEMERFLNQTDVLDVKCAKAILRKSQRQIDQNVSWRVFKRDGYCCRYCGSTGLPLTVDHIDLWEDGGASVEANLVSACRRCNKIRGNTLYEVWLGSADYARVSQKLLAPIRAANNEIVATLPVLRTMRINVRSK